MTFSESIQTCLHKFVTWQGRATRSEFWFFVLFGLLCQLAAAIVDGMLGTRFTAMDFATGQPQPAFYGWVYIATALALFLPNLAVTVRRLHDKNRSGWFYWIALIPLIGAIILLVWFCSRGTQGENRFGPDPLGGERSVPYG